MAGRPPTGPEPSSPATPQPRTLLELLADTSHPNHARAKQAELRIVQQMELTTHVAYCALRALHEPPPAPGDP